MGKDDIYLQPEPAAGSPGFKESGGLPYAVETMLELRTVLDTETVAVILTDVPMYTAVIVESVEDSAPNDVIARRLRELGFVAGELVRVVAKGPIGGEPLLIQVGFTRFALRRSEAARVRVMAVESGAAA